MVRPSAALKYFCFRADSRHWTRWAVRQRWAKTGREQMQQRECRSQTYSITSSAVICMISGTVRPSALAVLEIYGQAPTSGAEADLS
jgi:hypothetical protein